jgi:hypothetical protein
MVNVKLLVGVVPPKLAPAITMVSPTAYPVPDQDIVAVVPEEYVVPVPALKIVIYPPEPTPLVDAIATPVYVPIVDVLLVPVGVPNVVNELNPPVGVMVPVVLVAVVNTVDEFGAI